MHEFLPCAYGYATTIRRAQGASLDYVCLYSNADFPPDRWALVGAGMRRAFNIIIGPAALTGYL